MRNLQRIIAEILPYAHTTKGGSRKIDTPRKQHDIAEQTAGKLVKQANPGQESSRYFFTALEYAINETIEEEDDVDSC